MHLIHVFFLTLIAFDWKAITPNRIWIAIALKIAQTLAAQASAHRLKIIAAQVLTSANA